MNPGLLLLGGAIDVEITPKWRAQGGASYLRFVNTSSLENFLQVPGIEKGIGVDLFLGTQYRPLLNNNIIWQLGVNALIPDDGFSRLYTSDSTQFSAFTALVTSW